MSHSLDAYRSDLIKQLLYFDEEFSDELIRIFASIAERNKVLALTKQYCAHLDNLLNQAEQSDMRGPRVLIGSKVTIQYVPDNDQESYMLVLPNFSNMDDGHISFLSPLGMKLLLGRTGDLVEVNSPAGAYIVKIISIN